MKIDNEYQKIRYIMKILIEMKMETTLYLRVLIEPRIKIQIIT